MRVKASSIFFFAISISTLTPLILRILSEKFVTNNNLGNIKSIIEPNLPDDMDNVYKSQKIGDLGLIMIVAGVVASLFAGCILDAVKKFKV